MSSPHAAEIERTACTCGHAVMWHHERRGCGYHGYSDRDRCPCLLTVEEAVRERMAQAWDECRRAYFEADEHPVVNPYRKPGSGPSLGASPVKDEMCGSCDLRPHPGFTCDERAITAADPHYRPGEPTC